jgi:tRNA-uridine 2-sulfurtransferase
VRVVVAMSGGVDSSVAAALLVEQGHEVVGVHMKLHEGAPRGDGKHCCGLDDALDARRVADGLGIPFYVMDLREAFRRAVMDDFADTYAAGGTPNPCVRCNGVLKFQVLFERARLLGATHLATGHYARIGADGGLYAAADKDKDQSYFLFPIQPAVLSRVLFPLGALSKAAVRDHAARLGLATAHKPESQEVCFVPDDDHTGFVRRHLAARDGAAPEGAGDIVDEGGRVLGRHDAWWRFTVGQRRGLGVAAGAPLYVLSVDPGTRRVVVGPAERLEHQGLLATDMTWFARPTRGQPLYARIRHRGALVPCAIEGEDPLRLHFQAPARAVCPGQAVVLYDGDRVLGGGWIRERLS